MAKNEQPTEQPEKIREAVAQELLDQYRRYNNAEPFPLRLLPKAAQKRWLDCADQLLSELEALGVVMLVSREKFGTLLTNDATGKPIEQVAFLVVNLDGTPVKEG